MLTDQCVFLVSVPEKAFVLVFAYIVRQIIFCVYTNFKSLRVLFLESQQAIALKDFNVQLINLMTTVFVTFDIKMEHFLLFVNGHIKLKSEKSIVVQKQRLVKNGTEFARDMLGNSLSKVTTLSVACDALQSFI